MQEGDPEVELEIKQFIRTNRDILVLFLNARLQKTKIVSQVE
jgi:hypothetical protein